MKTGRGVKQECYLSLTVYNFYGEYLIKEAV